MCQPREISVLSSLLLVVGLRTVSVVVWHWCFPPRGGVDVKCDCYIVLMMTMTVWPRQCLRCACVKHLTSLLVLTCIIFRFTLVSLHTLISAGRSSSGVVAVVVCSSAPLGGLWA